MEGWDRVGNVGYRESREGRTLSIFWGEGEAELWGCYILRSPQSIRGGWSQAGPSTAAANFVRLQGGNPWLQQGLCSHRPRLQHAP